MPCKNRAGRLKAEVRMTLIEEIQETIEQALIGAKAIVLDPRRDGVHLQALVISSLFEGKSLVEQHRLVMHPLKEHFSTTLHALGLKTFTPDQWEKVKDQYQGEIG